jgi:hypothetical protein
MSRTIPADFPREGVAASVPGVQPKLLVRLEAETGRFVNGQNEADVEARHDMCQDLVVQLVGKCQTNRETKYRNLSEAQILERLLAQLLSAGWGTDAEMRWVVRHTAAELAWSIPEDAIVLRTMLGEIE